MSDEQAVLPLTIHNIVTLCVIKSCHRGVQTCMLPLVLALKVKGQRLRSNTPNFIRLAEPTEVDFHIKLHQNLTCNFQVIENYLIQIGSKIALAVTVEGQILPKSDHFYRVHRSTHPIKLRTQSLTSSGVILGGPPPPA